MNIKEEIRKQLSDLSQDELLKVFQEAGFNVTKGTGKITIYEDKSIDYDKN